MGTPPVGASPVQPAWFGCHSPIPAPRPGEFPPLNMAHTNQTTGGCDIIRLKNTVFGWPKPSSRPGKLAPWNQQIPSVGGGWRPVEDPKWPLMVYIELLVWTGLWNQKLHAKVLQTFAEPALITSRRWLFSRSNEIQDQTSAKSQIFIIARSAIFSSDLPATNAAQTNVWGASLQGLQNYSPNWLKWSHQKQNRFLKSPILKPLQYTNSCPKLSK